MNHQTFKIYSFLLLLWGILILASACSDSGNNPDKTEFIIPDKNVSFINDLQPMLEFRCGFESGCHSPSDTDSRFQYVELINKVPLMNHQLSATGEKLVDLSIHQKNPQLAPLYLLVKEGYPRAPEDIMPPYLLNRAPLTDNQIEGIRIWISEGCKD